MTFLPILIRFFRKMTITGLEIFLKICGCDHRFKHEKLTLEPNFQVQIRKKHPSAQSPTKELDPLRRRVICVFLCKPYKFIQKFIHSIK